MEDAEYITNVDFSQLLREQELAPVKNRICDLEQQVAALRAERDRMQPLVQAARRCVNDITDKESLLRVVGPLIDAVDTYEVESETK